MIEILRFWVLGYGWTQSAANLGVSDHLPDRRYDFGYFAD
jgi:hypothetical protein